MPVGFHEDLTICGISLKKNISDSERYLKEKFYYEHNPQFIFT